MKKVLNIMCQITGEMAVSSIPIAPGVDIAALKSGDENPLEVVVEIPATKSKRGWNYTEAAIKDIVNKVNTDTLNGFKGHQKAENVATEFPDIQTHWIGAVWNEQLKKAYFRGVMDKNATQLKDWVRTKRIKQVSIFGKPTLEKDNNGNVNVTRYDAMSIDWTPLDRPGMPTRVVASGEMTEFNDSFCNTGGNSDILDSNIDDNIFNNKTGGNNSMAGENTNNTNKTPVKPTKSELLLQLREMYINGEMTDIDLEENILKYTQSKIIKKEIKEAVGEMSAADITAAVKAKEAADNKNLDETRNTTIDKVVKSVITGEQAQKFIKEIYTTTSTDEAAIKGEIEELIKKDTIKNTINSFSNAANSNTGGGAAGGAGAAGGNKLGYLEDNKFLKPKF